ncbi:MAG: MOSC N-terminal beta barrel domain-containing protein [Cyanobacteria bacterium P01_D01_bin.128]
MSIHLSGLNIFPIKSARGIPLQQAQAEYRGLSHDRRWMVVDANNRFLTQRTLPNLALIQVRVSPQTLELSTFGQPPLVIPIPGEPADTQGADSQADVKQTLVEVEVWGDRCLALSCGQAAANWLSQALGTPCRLVYMPPSTHRPIDHGKFSQDHLDHGVSFADAYPYLLISEASLEDLNQRLASPVPMNRFRPNLVVQGCAAFAEDRWKTIRIGAITFQIAKPCSRCVITTVDQDHATRSPEPIKTLATYRAWEGKIWFGQNLLPLNEGTLHRGDRVEVLA